VIYLVLAVALRRGWLRIAVVAATGELIGVLSVGTVELLGLTA